MKVKFLGSGDAFGSGGRLQTCIMVESGQVKFLIDCGASALVSIRKFAVDPNELAAIFITHLHGDHFAGIPFFLLDAQMISKRTAPLVIAGPPGTQKRIIDAMEVMFPGSSKIQQKYQLDVVELPLEQSSAIAGIKVTPYPMVHPSGDPSTALRIEVDGKVLAYTGDTEWNEALIPAASGVDLFISEAYFFDKKIKFHLDVDTLSSQIDILKPKKIILTHMGADMLGRLENLPFDHANDGMEIIVP